MAYKITKRIFRNSEERARKISKTLKGHLVSEKTREKIRKSNLGRKCSEEARKRMSKAQKGRKISEEHRRKLSKARQGIKLSEETKRKLSEINKGKKLSEECKKKIGEACKGKKHPNWKGGITPINNKIRGSLEYKLWEDSCKSRDNWKCQKCSEKRLKYLTVHHILNFAKYIELRFAIDNGITFCRDCHKLFHKKCGIKNNTKKQLEEFIKL